MYEADANPVDSLMTTGTLDDLAVTEKSFLTYFLDQSNSALT
jgi:hypothetical protein